MIDADDEGGATVPDADHALVAGKLTCFVSSGRLTLGVLKYTYVTPPDHDVPPLDVNDGRATVSVAPFDAVTMLLPELSQPPCDSVTPAAPACRAAAICCWYHAVAATLKVAEASPTATAAPAVTCPELSMLKACAWSKSTDVVPPAAIASALWTFPSLSVRL